MHRTIFHNQMKKSIGILMLLSNDLSIYSHLHPYTLQCYLKCASIQIRTPIYIHIFIPNTRVNHNPFKMPIKIPCNTIDTQQKLLLVLFIIILFQYLVLIDISILPCIIPLYIENTNNWCVINCNNRGTK